MDRLEYDDPRLHPKEDEIVKFKNVKIYDGNEKNATFDYGEMVLTTHRIVYVQSGSSKGLALRLHYLVYLEEEKSSGFGFSKSKKLMLHLSEPLPGKSPGPIESSKHDFIRLSFKDGYDSTFTTKLSTVVLNRRWETVPISTSLPGAPPPVQLPGRQLRAGIVGIERQIQAKHKATDESISLAFEDLNKLMAMAKDMVHLSKSISDRIKERQGDISDDETVRFKSYLLSLGIEDPVTRDAFRSESQFHKTLAQQISSMLLEPIKDMGGMMTLTEAYCRVNRGRGLELLSPEDMLKACELMSSLSLPTVLKVFESGVKVLHINSHNDSNIIKATADALGENGSFTSEELAQLLGISVLLARERLFITEKAGKACRDDSIEGLRFYPNLLLGKN